MPLVNASSQPARFFEYSVIVKRIEEPRRRVRDEIKQDCAQNAAAEQRRERRLRFEASAEKNQDAVGGIIECKICQIRRAPDIVIRIFVLVKKIQANVRCEQNQEWQPPRNFSGKINARAKCESIGRAEILRQQPGNPRQREHGDKQNRQQFVPFFFHCGRR